MTSLASLQEEKASKSKTLVHKEQFEDFAQNSFKLTIGRVQQVALQKIGGKLPTPKEQLDLVNKRRDAKKSRTGASNHGLMITCRMFQNSFGNCFSEIAKDIRCAVAH